MSSHQEKQSRRDQIMNSEKELPGDADRAKAEESEDFDSADSGNFDTSMAGRQVGDYERRARIDQSEAQLEGDFQRGADDKRVDEGGRNEHARANSERRASHLQNDEELASDPHAMEDQGQRRASEPENYEELAGDAHGMEDQHGD